MAELTLRLIHDPSTGKRNIVVSLRSDEDALPHEHEEQHRALVNKLIEGGVLAADEVGQLIVERQADTGDAAPEASPQSPDERRARAQGS
jgi:hypothetical protein